MRHAIAPKQLLAPSRAVQDLEQKIEGSTARPNKTLLEGSGVVISGGYKSPNMGYTYKVTLLITLLITTHEPPSRDTKLEAGTQEGKEQRFDESVLDHEQLTARVVAISSNK